MRLHKGISLLEALLFISIAAVIIVLATRFAGTALRNMKEQHVIQEIQQITHASYEWLSMHKQSGFACNQQQTSHCVVISNQALYDARLIDHAHVATPWGGEIIVEPGQTGQYVRVTVSNVPEKACLGLVAQLKSAAKNDKNTCDTAAHIYQGEF